jgi:hypothetical protein
MTTNKVKKTDAEWRAMLDSMEYQVTRHAATERAFTGKFWDHHEHGIYTCVCCNTPLFASDAKFDSGCGWPSYFEALDPANVTEKSTAAMAWCARKSSAPCATPTWATFSRTARRPPACATASTRRRCASIRSPETQMAGERLAPKPFLR